MPVPRSARRAWPAVTAAALAIVAAAGGVGALVALPRDAPHAQAAKRPPVPFETLRLGGTMGLGAAVVADGDVWLDDRHDERLLRLAMPEARVTAGIRVHGRVALAAAAGDVWVLQATGGYGGYLRGPLLRVDARTNRVRARIPLRVPSGERVLGRGVFAEGRSVWVWGPRDILRIDRRRDRVAMRIRLGDVHGDVSSLAIVGRELVAALADGTFARFDARTGHVLGAVRTELWDPAIRARVGSRLIVTSAGTVASMTPSTGRVSWRRRLGYLAGAAAQADGALWINSAAVDEPGDRLTSFDPDTGAVLSTRILPAFSTTAVVPVAGRLLALSSGGRVLVVRPLIL